MILLDKILLQAAQRQDFVFAIFFVLVVAMLIIPLPLIVVDFLLTVNLALTLLILMSTLYLRNALELSTFPAMILVTTIFRLALTVSTTRLILAQGDAGELIRGFGNFVIGGNLVVGLVVFLIVALVQFMVITKGAERIAEVSARFTLDALPGKQMSIDADLRAGEITNADARKRRNVLERESQFHGSMDGAMRFVKGDAIAGFVVVFVNLFGGVMIGMFQRGMRFNDAIQLYALLTVGDGLIAQIPAMFIAISAGTVVTRVTSDESTNLGSDITRQLGAEPRSLAIAAGVIALMAFLPGFPTPIFLFVGALLGGFALLSFRGRARVERERIETEATKVREAQEAASPTPVALGPNPAVRAAEASDVVVARLHPDTLNALQETGLYVAAQNAGRAVAAKVGFSLPPVGFKQDIRLAVDRFEIDVEGVPVFRSRVVPGRMRIDAPADLLAERGIEIDKASTASRPGRAVAWVEPDAGRELQALGAQGAFAAGYIADQLRINSQKYAARAFGVNEGSAWIAELQPAFGRLANDVQTQISILTIVDVVRKLLDERISIDQPRPILEAILQYAAHEPNTDALTERVRYAMRRQITFANLAPDGTLPAILVAPDVEQPLRLVASNGEAGAFGQAEQQAVLRFVANLKDVIRTQEERDIAPVLLTPPDIRRRARNFLASQGVTIQIMGFSELSQEFSMKPLATVNAAPRAAAPPPPPRPALAPRSEEVL